MITALEFVHFQMLRDARLPLGRLTVLLGPNGSGKSTALRALQAVREPKQYSFSSLRTLGTPESPDGFVAVGAEIDGMDPLHRLWTVWDGDGDVKQYIGPAAAQGRRPRMRDGAAAFSMDQGSIVVFALEPAAIAAPVQLTQSLCFAPTGAGIAATLTTLQDQFPERFEALNSELGRWLPDFDRVMLGTPATGTRAFTLRQRQGRQAISADKLSHGTLFVVALITLAHLPRPPTIIGLEEPDRGLHPRLLRHVLDAIRRLTHPEEFGDDRDPVQVVLTSHSPYLVDHFKDAPEHIVLAEKQGDQATFKRLADHPHLTDIIDGAQLGEVWYSGILGGIPVGQ